MLITTAAILLAVGLICFVLGYTLGLYEVAVIAGVVVLGVGVMITGGNLEYQVGETEIEHEDGTIETQYETDSVDTPEHLPLGALVMLLGGVFVLRAFEGFSET